MEEQPIDQVLDTIITRLERNVRDPKVGKELAYDVRRFRKEYGKSIESVRGCEHLAEDTERIIMAFIPQGAKIAKAVWQTFETMGLWDAETEDIINTLDKTLTDERFIDDLLSGILQGCECRKKG